MLEDGVPAKVLGVDLVQPAKTTVSEAGKETPKTEISAAAAPPEVFAKTPQILYLDASLLQKQSVKKVCEMTAKNLDLSSREGRSRSCWPTRSRRPSCRARRMPRRCAALASLAKTAQGRDRLLDVRADFSRARVPGRARGPTSMLSRRACMRARRCRKRSTRPASLDRLGKGGTAAGAPPASLPRQRRIRYHSLGLLSQLS